LGPLLWVGFAIAGVAAVGGVVITRVQIHSDSSTALGVPPASGGEDLVPYDGAATHQFARTTLRVGADSLNVEVALTPEERSEIGLKGRTQLAHDSGLLYVYPNTMTLDGQVSWWETDGYLFPIDVVWLDETRHVVGVYENVPPDATRYASPGPIRYVIEMNGFAAADLGFIQGTVVDWDAWWE